MRTRDGLGLAVIVALAGLAPAPAHASPGCSARWPEIGELRLAPDVRLRIARGTGSLAGGNGTRICLGDQISPSPSDGSVIRPDLPPIPIVHDREIAIPTRQSTLWETLLDPVLRALLLKRSSHFVVHGTLGSDGGFALVGVAEGTAVLNGAPQTLAIPLVPGPAPQVVELRPPHDPRVFTAMVAAGAGDAEFRGIPIVVGTWRLRIVGTKVIGAFSMTQAGAATSFDPIDHLGLDAGSSALARACLQPEQAGLQSYQQLPEEGRAQILRWQVPMTSLSCAILPK